jgi:D-arabinose 1-dehydrogenase-like Zn-dependent alcohol dehydrogenase
VTSETLMRAIVQRATGGTDVLQWEDVAVPRPGPRQVRLRIASCGVCFHDVVVRNGTMQAGVRMPLIPGHEIAGTIDEIGSGVTRVRPGDRVATTQRAHVCGMCRFCRGGLEPLCAEKHFLGDAGLVGGYAEFDVVDDDQVGVGSFEQCCAHVCLLFVPAGGRIRLVGGGG